MISNVTEKKSFFLKKKKDKKYPLLRFYIILQTWAKPGAALQTRRGRPR